MGLGAFWVSGLEDCCVVSLNREVEGKQDLVELSHLNTVGILLSL